MTANQPSERDQIPFPQLIDVYRNSSESCELQCKPGLSKTMICSHLEGWWEARTGPPQDRPASGQGSLMRTEKSFGPLYRSRGLKNAICSRFEGWWVMVGGQGLRFRD